MLSVVRRDWKQAVSALRRIVKWLFRTRRLSALPTELETVLHMNCARDLSPFSRPRKLGMLKDRHEREIRIISFQAR